MPDGKPHPNGLVVGHTSIASRGLYYQHGGRNQRQGAAGETFFVVKESEFGGARQSVELVRQKKANETRAQRKLKFSFADIRSQAQEHYFSLIIFMLSNPHSKIAALKKQFDHRWADFLDDLEKKMEDDT